MKKKITFIPLLILPAIMLSAGVARGQTASTKSISDVLTPGIKQELAKKQHGVPVDPALSYNKLPSGSALPKQATDAAQKYNAREHANSGRRDKLPGNSAFNAEVAKQRNMQKLSAIKNNSRGQVQNR